MGVRTRDEHGRAAFEVRHVVRGLPHGRISDQFRHFLVHAVDHEFHQAVPGDFAPRVLGPAAQAFEHKVKEHAVPAARILRFKRLLSRTATEEHGQALGDLLHAAAIQAAAARGIVPAGIDQEHVLSAPVAIDLVEQRPNRQQRAGFVLLGVAGAKV